MGHDGYRVDEGGKPTFDRVMRGLDHLQAHEVRWNVLTTVHHANEDHGLAVYRFLRDDVAARYIQLIPIVERPAPGGIPTGSVVTDRSVSPHGYGRFLIDVFEDWVRHDVGQVYVKMFDATLASSNASEHLGSGDRQRRGGYRVTKLACSSRDLPYSTRRSVPGTSIRASRRAVTRGASATAATPRVMATRTVRPPTSAVMATSGRVCGSWP